MVSVGLASATALVVAMLPVWARFAPVVGASDLIALVIHNKNHANGSKCGRKNKDQNPTTQGFNHSSARGGSLRIAERTILGKSRYGGHQQDQSRQCQVREPKARFTFHRSSQEGHPKN